MLFAKRDSKVQLFVILPHLRCHDVIVKYNMATYHTMV